MTDIMLSVRLTQQEIKDLEHHTKGHTTRAAIVRLLVQAFLDQNKKQQQDFLLKSLFRRENKPTPQIEKSTP